MRPRRYNAKLVDSHATSFADNPTLLLKKQVKATANSSAPTISNTYRNGITRIGSPLSKIRTLPQAQITLATALIISNAPTERIKNVFIYPGHNNPGYSFLLLTITYIVQQQQSSSSIFKDEGSQPHI